MKSCPIRCLNHEFWLKYNLKNPIQPSIFHRFSLVPQLQSPVFFKIMLHPHFSPMTYPFIYIPRNSAYPVRSCGIHQVSQLWNSCVQDVSQVFFQVKSYINHMNSTFSKDHRIGWWEFLQESPSKFDGKKNHGFPVQIFPNKPIQWKDVHGFFIDFPWDFSPGPRRRPLPWAPWWSREPRCRSLCASGKPGWLKPIG